MPRSFSDYSQASQAPALQRAWQSMRVMRRFTTHDVMTTAEIGESALQKYVRSLHGAGFLKLVTPRVSGRPGSRDMWMLVRDSGPLAPIRRKDGTGVFDVNTKCAWGPDGKLQADREPPPGKTYSLAQREALRMLLDGGVTRASAETLHGLSRAGLVVLDVRLTDIGRAVATDLPPTLTQRDKPAATGRALKAEAHHD